jgi:hypothetical protein
MGASNITQAIASIPEERRLGLSVTHWIEANPRADVETERRYDEFVKDLKFLKPPSHDNKLQIPSAFRPPSDLSTAFGRMLDEVNFRDKLETFAEEVGRTKEVEIYLVRWSAFMNAFIDKVFTVRALLEAARVADDLRFDIAAGNEMNRMSKMMEGAPIAFQRNVADDLGETWAFNLVGMQLERINQAMNTVGYYPKLIEKYGGKELKQWRSKTIRELSRLTDLMTYLRGVENYLEHYKTNTSSLTIDLPKEGVDLFVAHPKQGKINFEAVKENARSFYYLWAAMLEVVLEAGRNREKKTKIKIVYSPTMGALLIKDKKPLFKGALYPFATEPPHSRLWSLVDRMGPGANLWMKWASFDLKGMSLMHTISQMVVQLADALVPDRKMTFDEARQQVVATRIDIGADRVARVDETSEDSGVNPMAKVFAFEDAKPNKLEFTGIVRETSQTSEQAFRGDEIFAEIAAEGAMEAGAVEAMQSANTTSTGVLASVSSVLPKG